MEIAPASKPHEYRAEQVTRHKLPAKVRRTKEFDRGDPEPSSLRSSQKS